MKKFDHFIGVDWSGDKRTRLKGLKVAMCGPGTAPPELIANPDGWNWSRPAFAEWLLANIQPDQSILCGIDFSFCFPWCDVGAYYPGKKATPTNRVAFWRHVEELCEGNKNFYGGAVARHPDYREWFAEPHKGQYFARRLRVTEQACQDQGLGTPETVFKLVGHRQVGKGSLAGMRVLAHVKKMYPAAAIWPFDDIAKAGLVIVETFPTAFVNRARAGPGKVRDVSRLNRVLRHFGSVAIARRTPEFTDDETDALISAAALRQLSACCDLWNPDGLSDRVRRYEGWTFGIG